MLIYFLWKQVLNLFFFLSYEVICLFVKVSVDHIVQPIKKSLHNFNLTLKLLYSDESFLNVPQCHCF